MEIKECTIKQNGDFEVTLIFSHEEIATRHGINPLFHLHNVTDLISKETSKLLKEVK
jgi:hypothetical protein